LEITRSRLEASNGPRLLLLGHSFGCMVILGMLGDPALRAEYAAEADQGPRPRSAGHSPRLTANRAVSPVEMDSSEVE